MFKANFTTRFVDAVNGDVLKGEFVSSPLFVRNTDDTATFLGSTFFITRTGLMITAKHCLFDSDGKHYQKLFIGQHLPNHKYVIRPIVRTYCNESDVALLIPVGMTHDITKEKLLNPIMGLTNFQVCKGDKIASFAWPLTTTGFENGVTIDTGYKWHYGIIEDFHEEGVPTLKNSCYQSCMHINGGSSGGMVVDENGYAFAINSTGADVADGIEPYSFLSPVSLCFDIKIELEDGKWVTVQDLIHEKQIRFQGYFIVD